MTVRRFVQTALVAVTAWLSLGGTPSRADFLTSLSVEVSPEAGGLTRYNYTLDNLASSTLPAVQFALSVSPDADLADLSGPDGWLITYQPGDEMIEFLSLAEETDLLPGSTARFFLTSPLGPSLTDFLIVGLDPTTATIEISQGQIASPVVVAAPVPEPSTLALLGIGVLGLISATRRCRASSPTP